MRNKLIFLSELLTPACEVHEELRKLLGKTGTANARIAHATIGLNLAIFQGILTAETMDWEKISRSAAEFRRQCEIIADEAGEGGISRMIYELRRAIAPFFIALEGASGGRFITPKNN